MIYGYARVSKEEQNLDQQIEALKALGAQQIFSEKMSTRQVRPELQRLLETVTKGDSILIVALDRIARSIYEAIGIFEDLRKRDIGIRSIRESWIDTTVKSEESEIVRLQKKMFMLTVAGFAELERALIRERTMEGLKAARAKGRVGGRPEKLSLTQKVEARSLLDQGWSRNRVAKLMGVKIDTLARSLGLWRTKKTGQGEKEGTQMVSTPSTVTI